MPCVPRCRNDNGVAAACSLLSVPFWNLSCRLIVRVLPSVPLVVPALPLGRGRPVTSCNRSNSNAHRTMTSAPDCPTTHEVPAVTRAVTRAARRSHKRTPRLPRKALAVAAPSPASRESSARHPRQHRSRLAQNGTPPHGRRSLAMMIAAPAQTMIATNDLTTMATAATPLARIAMTEAGDPGVDGADAAVRDRPPTVNVPADRVPLQLGPLHLRELRNRAATGVAATRAGLLTEAASPTEDSPPPEARPIADPLPLAATVALPNNPNLNHSPNPKADAVAATVAASAVRPGIASPAICKTPLSRLGMSSANWSR